MTPTLAAAEPTTDTPFSLHVLVADVVDGSDKDDPRELALEVLDKIGDGDLRAALVVTLPGYVRDVMRVSRADTRRRSDSDAVDSSSEQQGRSRSPKWDSASAVYIRALRARYCVAGTWKQFALLTVDDCLTVASERVAQAKATATEGQRMRLFANACKKHKAATVGDLPEAVVLQILRWEPEQ